MNQPEVTRHMAEQADSLKIDAEKFQLALRSAIEAGLRKEGEVSLWGIGKFYIRGKAVKFTPDKRLVKKATAGA